MILFPFLVRGLLHVSQFDMECLGVVSFCIVPITALHIQCLIDRVSEWLVAGPRHDGMPCDRWSRWQTVR